MPLIRCTKKLVAEMSTQVVLSAEQPHTALLGDWYANLLRVDRRQCVIFTSERTLLTFLVVAVNRDAIRDYATLFRRGLRQVLESEGFSSGDVDRMLDDYQELSVALTTNRSVLGSLNDFARMAAAHVEHDGGVSRCDLVAVNHKLNLTPMSRLGMASPLATTRHCSSAAILPRIRKAGLLLRGRNDQATSSPTRCGSNARETRRSSRHAIPTWP